MSNKYPLTTALPNNQFLASFVIFGWLIFKPSAWRDFVNNIDPCLTPDFNLVELNKTHWNNKMLQKLLFLGHGLWSIWVCSLVILILWLLNIQAEVLILTSVYALFFSFIGGILGSFTVSVAFGIMAGIFGGILLSLPIGFNEYNIDNLDNMLVFSMAENIAIAVMFNVFDLQDSLRNIDRRSLWTVILGIFTASCAGSIMYSSIKTTVFHPQYRQIGSIIIGVFISGLAVFFITGIMSILAPSAAWMQTGTLYVLAYDGLIVIVFSVALSSIWFFLTWQWKYSLKVGLSICLFLTILILIKNILTTSSWNTNLSPLILGIYGGIENAILYMSLFAFPYVLAKRIANAWAGIIAGVFGSAGTYIIFTLLVGHNTIILPITLTLLALLLGMSFNWWRPILFYPFQAAWNLILHHADERNTDSNLLHLNAAFWDEQQHLPLFGLESYLVMIV
ncbi:MAG: hypothetical protein KAG43_05505, partial [Candidatus Marithrix sp.]|nr:hypothetical protein [Candidatus Marithrix sp.]